MGDGHLVFVYGSLRKHESNHGLLDASQLVCHQCATAGRLYDTGQGYPAMVPSDNGERVYGELYRVTTDVLKCLDELEGYRGEGEPNEYDRVVQRIETDQGPVDAYVYVYPEERVKGMLAVPSGDWKYHRLQLQQDCSIHYFAYGSCMDNRRFKRDGVDHLFRNVVGRGVAEGYTLRFTRKAHDGMGRADMVEIGGTVEGKVYRIGQEALEYLLVREGVDEGCYRPAFLDIRLGDHILKDVLTFFVVDKQPEEVAPPEEYLQEILDGGATVWTPEYAGRFKEEVRLRFGAWQVAAQQDPDHG